MAEALGSAIIRLLSEEKRMIRANDLEAAATLTRQRMQAVGRRDTAAELALRRRLHARGYRYRVDASLPMIPRRRADLLFPRRRVAVFVDGCFWHSCAEHGSVPVANQEWWVRKLTKIQERDRDTESRLLASGWRYLRVWEHEDMDAATLRVVQLLSECGP